MARFGKLLVANRGEIARRIIATAHDMGISTVAVCSDADAHAPYVAEADEVVRLPGTRAADTYLDVDRIVGAARTSGAHALHPGYGFLAESASLAEACREAGIVFVGPPPEAMRAMSRKVEAKALAAAAGLPVLPTVVVGPDGSVSPPDAEGLRFPVLVKASAGGGGTGIRTVAQLAALGEAIGAASRDAVAAFGDGTVFLEPLLQPAHHVEVQILSDGRQTVHLFERECSVQRRHQKLIEETPSPAVAAELREQMTTAAVALADAVGYEGAGTVEFLVGGDEFFFLEMNTRLQVEHRVTELVTGIDIVRAQLEIASGRALAFDQRDISLCGHAVEARLYAEDPADGYAPSTGTVRHYHHETQAGLLFDDAVAGGSEVSPYYDGLLSKVVARGTSRAEAAARLGRALRRIELDGVVTNRRLLVEILADDEFLVGGADTGFLERREDLVRREPDAALLAAHAIAAAASRARRTQARSPLGFAPTGWRNVPATSEAVVLRAGRHDLSVTVDWATGEAGVDVDGVAGVVTGAKASPTATGKVVDVTTGGVVHRCSVRSYGDRWSVNSAEGQSDFALPERTASGARDDLDGAVTAPVPGTVTAVLFSKGDEVRGGDVVVVIEAMKMEHRVAAPFDGVVEVAAAPGEVVEAHQVVLVVARAPS